MPVVGTLTVDLVANTATFTADLGRAGNSLEDFGKKANEAGDAMDFSMREARGSMMLVGEELGIHLPRELRTLLAEIPGIGVAFATMLPIIGVVAAIAIVSKLIEKHREALQELSTASASVDGAIQKSTTATKTKLLELDVEFDNLTKNHAKALIDEMKLLDAVTLEHLAAEFENLAKLGDKVFEGAEKAETSFWFGGQFNSAAKQVKEDLDKWNTSFELLLSTGSKAEVASAATQHLADVTAALSKEQALAGKETGHKDRVEALQQELHLAQALQQEYANADAIEGKQKKVDVQKDANQEAQRQEGIYREQQTGLKKRLDAEFEFTKKKFLAAEEAAKKTAHLDAQIDEEQIAATRAVSEEILRSQEKSEAEELKQSIAMAKLKQSAQEQEAKHALVMHQSNAKQVMDAEIKAANDRTQIETRALDKEIADLQKYGDKELAKIQELENKKKQIVQQNENQIVKITETAEEQKLRLIQQAENRTADAIAKTAARSIVEGKSMVAAFEQVGKQMLETALTNLLQMETITGREKLMHAEGAATKAFHMAPFPFGPIAAAATFAGVMAFANGGLVPGSGSGDTVPAMLSPGETVVSKQLTDSVRNNNTTNNKGGDVHVHTTVHAVDASGFEGLLTKHANVVAKHVKTQMRKANR
ncbi:MAG TPA: hypothetical protein VKR59_07945 [Terriglobales bacterium]|nr:hypothetical protein [Terriglobales bacterium]